MPATPKTVIVCHDHSGVEPFTRWLRTVIDKRDRATILKRVARFDRGLFGDVEPVGEAVFEARIHDGPGYRVYFAQTPTHVYLLGGGTKRRQQRDIDAAQELWSEYA